MASRGHLREVFMVEEGLNFPKANDKNVIVT